jgi:UDP-N-acetylmuramoylalanine--D-glutamate ligase
MNNKIKDLQEFLKGKKIAVLGVGISNKPLIRYLHKFTQDITAFDMAAADDKYILMAKSEFEADSIFIKWSLGADYLDSLKGFDIIFKTPKVRIDLPQLLKERKKGCIITSEMEIFMQFCPCKIIAVTGSDGKTTTTTMISLFLKQEGYTVHVGGNIGKPLLSEIDTINDTDMAVLELSSFQLHAMRTSPDVALITNISPNHLDVHKNYAEYVNAKASIFMYQNVLGKLVLNFNDRTSKKFETMARGEVQYFLKKERNGFYYDSENIYFPPKQKIARKKIFIKGEHNLENYCAAIACVRPFASDATIARVIETFGGVEHRIEYVRAVNGVDYYNSSIDSSPTRTKATLKSFAQDGIKVIIIAGGKDKNSDYQGLGEEMLKVSDRIILCGENANHIKKSLMDAVKANPVFSLPTVIETESYEDAVKEAARLAKTGEAVVLTPAGTSFDKFRNFEERGILFKELVNKL